MTEQTQIVGDTNTVKALAQLLQNGSPHYFKIEQVVWGELITLEFGCRELTITSVPTDQEYDGNVVVTTAMQFKSEGLPPW